jgi:HAMP domain-containing protein
MKLAEALIWRADAKKRLEQLKQRLVRSAKVQEGDAPAEDPAALLAEHERLSSEFMRMVQRINRTNVVTVLREDVTLADALAVRDSLTTRVDLLRTLTQAAAITQDRYTKSEVKFRSTVNVAELQQQINRLAVEHRDLDAQIQGMNWQVELLE